MANTTGIGIVVFPLLESYGGSGSAGAITFPLLVAEGYGPGGGSLTLPLLEALGIGTSLGAIGAMTFPTLVALGSGTPGEIGRGKVIFPLLSTSGQGYSQVIGTGGLAFPLLISGGTGLSGTIGVGSGSLQLLSVSGLELCDSRGSGALVFPLIEAYGYGIDVPIMLIRRAIVMNLSNHAVTHYENFDFNSIVQFNGVLIGANENGVYILGGDNDLGQYIESELTGGLIDLSERAVKTALEGWLAGRSDLAMDLRVTVDEGNVYEYPFVKFGNNHEARAKIGKGLNKHRFFTFGLKNKSGSNFDLQSFRILGDVVGRKTR